ncbi:hypothetical protein PR202_ga30477 [Eleusine coracana subsp. coracana]|uniref:non-specific serine/threonine protein kinase n=1 Tax=Eleusine coracana subsp. coracana TaxID=191504 RepID=A0AAV5DNI1_ELECO|nr:hypothetical protein PR202_ga30477 [Eleusine coracana subsp. coracana]
MMDGLQTTSAIAQVVGVDAFALITMIVRAANTASQNKKTCRQLAKQVEQIRELLRSMEEQPGAAILRRPETSAPFLDLHDTLRRACTLVESCQHGGCVRQFCAGGARAARLRDVQGRIDSFLRLFPIISHLDSTRLLVQVINSSTVREQSSGAVCLDLDMVVRMNAGPSIEWPTRFRIIEGVAQGALYLHNHSRHRIIHRDLKPSNILLDCNMNPAITSFDLAKYLSPDKDQDTTDCVVGSLGYIAPEYMEKGAFSVKTDVYSFGVMVLEIISGKRWTKSLQETYYRDLLTWAFKTRLWRGGKLELRLKDFIHASIQGVSFCSRTVPRCLSFPARKSILSQQREMIRCVRVALLCIQENPKRRPDMTVAERMLRPRKTKLSLPRRPGYARESSMYAGDRSMTA